MKMLLTMGLLLALAVQVPAQEREDESIQFATGLPMPTLIWKGDIYRMDDEPVLEALAQRPLAALLVQGFRDKQGLSAGLGVIAGVGLFSSMGLMMTALGGDNRALLFEVSNDLAVATVLTAVGAVVVHLVSYADLSEAVEVYNHE